MSDKIRVDFKLEDIPMILDTLKKEIDKNKDLEERIEKVSKRIKLLGKFDGEKCTRGFKVMSADFSQLLETLEKKEV